MAKIAVTDYGTDYITVYVSELGASAKYAEFYIDGEIDRSAGDGDGFYTLTTNSVYHTFTGLSPGTSYTLYTIVYNSSWKDLYFANNTVTQTTDGSLPPAEFTWLNIITGYPTAREVLFTTSFKVLDAGSYYLEYILYDEMGDIVYDVTSDIYSLSAGGVQRSVNKTFERLSPNSYYCIEIWIWRVGNRRDERLDIDPGFLEFTTEELVRPSDWEWVSTVKRGQTVTTKEVDGGYHAYYLTADEWNDFVDRVREFSEYVGVANTALTRCYVDRGDIMDYSIVETVREAIKSLIPPVPVPNAIVQYSKITAAYINGLKDSLNSIE